jgi:large subunit ribosomal protein L17
MRHAVRGRKLGRTSAHREALFRNQLQSLVERERIVTTLPKAKELRPIAEKVITRGKHGTVHARRWVLRWVLKRDLVKKVFDDIAPRFEERPGGYLRIVKLGPRPGDGAEMAVLELVDREGVAPKAEPAKEGGKAKKEPKSAKPKEPRREGKGEARGEVKKESTRKGGKRPSTPQKTG